MGSGAPYSKWFGSAFARLACAARLLPEIDGVLRAEDWQGREASLAALYEAVGELHNALQITTPLDTGVIPFYTRPYKVAQASLYIEALRAALADEQVRALPARLGAVDQVVTSTDVLEDLDRLDKLTALYDPPENG